jgi:hypothetical protein
MIEDKKAALRAEIARRERELAKLDALPDFETLVDGTVAALFVTLGRSRPYVFIAYKTRDLWYLTGKRSPDGVSSDALAEWLTTQGRRLESVAVLAEVGVENLDVAVDLAVLLDGIQERPVRRVANGGLIASDEDAYGERIRP